MRFVFIFSLAFIFTNCFAQGDSTKSLKLNVYFESYYSYDYSKPANFEKPDFNYNYKKHNQLNLNLAFAKLGKTNIRGQYRLQAI